MRYCAKNGLSVFYDGLNPLAGLGGGAPGDKVEQGQLPQSTLANNTAGLLKPDWTSPWLDKLHLLEELPSTRIIDLLQSMPFNFGVSDEDKKKIHPPPAPQVAYPDGEYPEWLRPSPPPTIMVKMFCSCCQKALLLSVLILLLCCTWVSRELLVLLPLLSSSPVVLTWPLLTEVVDTPNRFTFR